jgi:hypothetical protein
MGKTMLHIEQVLTPVDVRPFQEEARRCAGTQNRLLKVGVAVVVLDQNDRMLLLAHEARDGEYVQGALGPSMETLRFQAPTIGDFAESPMEAWQRSLGEELKLDTPDKIKDAELYFAEDSVLGLGSWYVATGRVAAFHMVLRTANPYAFSYFQGSEEINETVFMKPEEALKCNRPKRPGFDKWLREIHKQVDLSKDKQPRIYVEPLALPRKLMPDVRFDHINYGH